MAHRPHIVYFLRRGKIDYQNRSVLWSIYSIQTPKIHLIYTIHQRHIVTMCLREKELKIKQNYKSHMCASYDVVESVIPFEHLVAQRAII